VARLQAETDDVLAARDYLLSGVSSMRSGSNHGLVVGGIVTMFAVSAATTLRPVNRRSALT